MVKKKGVAAELSRMRRRRVVAAMHGFAVDSNTNGSPDRRLGLRNDVVSGRHLDRFATRRADECVHV